MDATRLADYVYCHAAYPLAALPHPLDPSAQKGRGTHERIRDAIRLLTQQRGGVGRESGWSVMQEPRLAWSKRALVGRPDLVLRHPTGAIVADFKTAAAPPSVVGLFEGKVWDNHGAQVLAYALAAAECYRLPVQAFVVYSARDVRPTLRNLVTTHPDDSPGKTLARLLHEIGTPLKVTPDNEARLTAVYDEIRGREDAGRSFERNHASPNKCYMCVHRSVCAKKLGDIPPQHLPQGPSNPGPLAEAGEWERVRRWRPGDEP